MSWEGLRLTGERWGKAGSLSGEDLTIMRCTNESKKRGVVELKAMGGKSQGRGAQSSVRVSWGSREDRSIRL